MSVKRERELGRAAFYQGSAGGQSPALRRALGDGLGTDGSGEPVRSAPDQRAADVEPAVTICASPRRAIAANVLRRGTRIGDAVSRVRRGTRNRDLAARPGQPQGALDQQRATLVEAELAQLYAHDGGDLPHKRFDRTEAVHGLVQRGVAFSTARPPLLEPFEIEQRPDRRVGIRHAKEQLAKPIHQLAGRAIQDGEIAVVVLRRGREHAGRAGLDHALLAE